MIADALIEKARDGARHRKIKDVRAGLGYTCVMLEDASCGLAYTFRNRLGRCCGLLDEAGELIGRPVEDLLPWAADENLLKAAVGYAAVNAVVNGARKDWETGNVLRALKFGPDDVLGMVGAFEPILKRVKDQPRKVCVFELDPAQGDGFYSDADIPRYLPACSVVVITATSLVNQTFDAVIPHCANAKEVCVLGPTTPLCPDVFSLYPVTLLAGSVVEDPEKALQIISQGGGTMAMKPAVRQVIARI